MYRPDKGKKQLPDDRAEKQQLAAERKKALTANLPWMRGTAAASERPQPSQPSNVAEGPAVARPTSSAPSAPHLARHTPRDAPAAAMGLPLWADDATTPLKAAGAVETLASQLLYTAQNKFSGVLLLWPGSLRSLGMAHAVACATRWHQGDKQGVRTLVYPAKANFLQALNHAHIDRSALVRLAQHLVEVKPNPAVTVSLPEKDPFWLALNSIKSDGSGAIHPTLAELLPHFFADKDYQSWKACDGDLLRYVKARITDVDHRRALSSLSLRALGEIDNAPDALLAVSWRASEHDIRQCLKSLRTGRQPEVLLLDATRSLRKDNPTWKANLVKFLDCAWETWRDRLPPVLIVVDEPHVRTQLWQELEKRAKKNSAAAAALLRSGLPIRGTVCTVNGDSLMPAARHEPLTPEPRKIVVNVADTEAANAIEMLTRVRREVTNPTWGDEMDEAAGYLARLAALPSSTRVLVNWLNEADVPMGVRQNYAWPVYKSKLAAIRNDPTFGERTRLDRVIAKGDEMWRNYENGTPLARMLAELIEQRTRGTEKCCLVFTKPTARRLAERYFETYDGYPEGAGFEILRDSVRFVVSRNLDLEADAPRKETLIFVGLDEVSLRMLVLEPCISSPAYVLLTRRNAAYLEATIRAVRTLPGFSSLSSRLEVLWKQLPEFPDIDEYTLFKRGDFVLPTFSFEQGLSSVVNEHEEHDPTAWELVLDSGASVKRSPAARAYRYDPALAHTSTRGFKGLDVSELQEGDRIFVMSLELRELTEAALKEAGIPISHDRRFEEDLRRYHRAVSERVAQISGATLSLKAAHLHDAITHALGPKVAPPAEGTVRAWLDVERFAGRSFDDAKPGAPRTEAHFKAFAKTLGMDDIHAVYFWKAVIQPLRGVRRADGRRVSDVYAEMLLEPESTVVHRRLKPAIVQMLFERAKENIHTVEAIRKPQGEEKDE
jgi:hypothetical protein